MNEAAPKDRSAEAVSLPLTEATLDRKSRADAVEN